MQHKYPARTKQKIRGFNVWLPRRPNNLTLLITVVAFTAFVVSSVQTASTFYYG